jgi:hypothetical protein
LLLDPADAVSSNVSSTVRLTSIAERADPPPSSYLNLCPSSNPCRAAKTFLLLPLYYSNNGCERRGPALLYLKAFRFQLSPPRVFIRYSIPPHYSIFPFPLSIILLAFNPPDLASLDRGQPLSCELYTRRCQNRFPGSGAYLTVPITQSSSRPILSPAPAPWEEAALSQPLC